MHQTLIGGTLTIQNAGVGVNGVGGAAMNMAATASGQQKFTGKGSTLWSALTDAVNMSGPAATTQGF